MNNRALAKDDLPAMAMDLLRGEWHALDPELEDRLIDPFASM